MKKITSSVAIISSVFASACCLLPVLLAGVAGIAGVASVFEKLRLPFIVVATLFLGYGFYIAYFQKKKECAPGEACSTSQGKHKQRIILWVITVLVTLVITFPYWIQLL
ncbi:MAG: mercury transporter MerT [Deltaproteobacteria bacterium]|nr:mercury transporter MerT [Deltaproteobacteria bacterium]